MYYDEGSRAFNFLAGVCLGAAIGATLALLLAPESGDRTRRRLIEAMTGARTAASGRLDEWSDDVRSAVKAGRRRFSR